MLKSNSNAMTCYLLEEACLHIHVFDSVKEFAEFMRENPQFIAIDDISLKIHGEPEVNNNDD